MEPERDRRNEPASEAVPQPQPQVEPRTAPATDSDPSRGGDFGGRGRGEAYIPLPQAPQPPKRRGWLVAVAAAVLAVAAAGVVHQRSTAVMAPVSPLAGPVSDQIKGMLAPAETAAFTAKDLDAAATSQAKQLLASPQRGAALAAAQARLAQKRAATPEQLAALEKSETPEQRVAEVLAASPEGVRAQLEKGAAGFYTFHIQAEDEGGDVIDVVVDGAPLARVITTREGATVTVPLDPKTPHVFTETLVFSRPRTVYVKNGPALTSPPPPPQTRLGIASSAGESRSHAVGPGESAAWTVEMGGGGMGQ